MLTYLLALSLISGLTWGAPYLGGHVYQHVVDPYLYVTPNPVIYQPYQHLFRVGYNQQQLINNQQFINHVGGHNFYQVSSPPQEDLPEINQFHSEDAEGRVLYGFHGHNQARMEARDPQGRVRGSYSYVDPHGQVVRMDYWDDGHGFQARGHNLPKPIYDFPTFTPEVQAARDQHLKLYEQILLSTIQAQHHNKIPVDDYPYVERPDGAVSSPTNQNDEDDTVEVGVYPSSPDNSENYPGAMRIPGEFQQPTFPFQNQNDEDLESIALDNPELQDFGRGAKSLGTKDNNQEGSNQQDKVQQHEKDAKDESKKTDEKNKQDKGKDQTTERVIKKNEELNKSEDESKSNDENTKHKGFSYHFQYTLGVPAEKESPKFEKVSSIAASEPVPKDKKTSIHNVHPLPLHTMTSIGDDNLRKAESEYTSQHDLQTSPYHPLLQRPIIIKSYPSPLSADHNNHVTFKRTPINAKTELPKAQ